MGYEFATAVPHNSHYFNKWDNIVETPQPVAEQLCLLVSELLKSRRVKDWFRAYFNYGLIQRIYGSARLLPCGMGMDGFFVDPWGDVLPCNGMDQKQPMGNLNTQSWDDIWNSRRTERVRQLTDQCTKECWMIGSAAPAMWKNLYRPATWILRNKLRMLLGRRLDLSPTEIVSS